MNRDDRRAVCGVSGAIAVCCIVHLIILAGGAATHNSNSASNLMIRGIT